MLPPLEFFSANKDAIVTISALGALAMTAVTAALSILGTILAKKIDERIKRQESIRKLLEDSMIGTGENMHEVLATAEILLKKFQRTAPVNSPDYEASIAIHKNRIDNNKKHLLNSKTKYRYKLYGLEQGLTTIARVADWIKGLREHPQTARALLDNADRIRRIVDREIIRYYRKGDYPGRLSRWRIGFYAYRIRRLWKRHKSDIAIIP